MDSIEKYGKTEEDAINEALKELNASIDEVEITVLESGSKGLLGLGLVGSKLWKISAKKKFDPEGASKKFLREVADAMGIAIVAKTEFKERNLNITVEGPDAGRLIGKHGKTLDAFQYLISLVINRGTAPFVNVMLDCENYRQKRKETLENLARNMAKKAKQTRRNVILEPMSSYERRIIHAALQSDKMINTFSEGNEPYRNVVISPKRY